MYESVKEAVSPVLGKHHVDWDRVEEIRLRCGQPIMLTVNGQEQRVAYIPDKQMIQRIMSKLGEHSLHAYQEQLRQGFFTIRGGIRIGVGGRAIEADGCILRMDDYTSLNIRFPREIVGLAKGVLPYLLQRGRLCHTLLISPPQQGKTTLLRDIIRCASAGEHCLAHKCSVIDSREELWAEGFDLGPRTDVLRCSKQAGMPMALRALSPQVIAMDELGDTEEWNAFAAMAAAGVVLLATAHGDTRTSRYWPLLEKLRQYNMPERCVLLSDTLGRGTVEQVLDTEGKPMLRAPLLLKGDPGYAV